MKRETNSDVFKMTEEERKKLKDPESDVDKVEIVNGNKKATFERIEDL